jgi:ABC-type uncharacterized transport system substrate-binding protein
VSRRQLVPNITAVAMLINPKFPTASAEAREVQDAARVLGIQMNLLNASTESEIDAAFTTVVEQRSGARATIGCLKAAYRFWMGGTAR